MRPKEKFAITEPAKCTGMSKEEMEYDGGFHLVLFAVSVITSAGASVCAKSNNKWVKALSVGLECTSLATGVVSGACAIESAFKAAKAAKAATSVVKALNHGKMAYHSGKAIWGLGVGPVVSTCRLASKY